MCAGWVGRVLRLRRNTHWQTYASFDSLLSRADLGHFGKWWIFHGATTRRLPYRANGFFYPIWNRLYRFADYVADCQALTWPICVPVMVNYSTCFETAHHKKAFQRLELLLFFGANSQVSCCFLTFYQFLPPLWRRWWFWNLNGVWTWSSYFL